MNTSENKEAAIVAAGTIAMAATAYISALPIPIEIKAPTVTFIGSVAAAILAYWKTKVNKIAE